MNEIVRAKGRLEDLAIFGGPPLLEKTLHVGGPNLGDREALFARFNEMLDRNWVTNNGPLVKEFEQRISEFIDVRHCVAMCNGTVALEIACRALDLEGEVILPSFTFVATAHALQWQGIQPVFCDVEPNTHCIDPGEVERHITPRTTGIIGVNVWGQTCQVETLQEIADRNHLQLLFDSAHAFGASHNGRMVGAFGRCEVFSFHATKFLNSFEGGAVVTNDDELAEKMRLMRNFGFSGMDEVIYIGTNGKMTEVCAAMGLTNLDSFDDFLETNLTNYHGYRDAFRSFPGVRLLEYDDGESCNYQYIVTEVGPEFGLTRDQLMTILHAENIRARRYFWPGCHRMEPYKSFFPHANLLLPTTESIAEKVLLYPTGISLRVDDVTTIGRLMRFLSRNADAISSRLGSVEKNEPEDG